MDKLQGDAKRMLGFCILYIFRKLKQYNKNTQQFAQSSVPCQLALFCIMTSSQIIQQSAERRRGLVSLFRHVTLINLSACCIYQLNPRRQNYITCKNKLAPSSCHYPTHLYYFIPFTLFRFCLSTENVALWIFQQIQKEVH